ncbi:Highly reducing polyketide synthase gloL [Cladobotryum mycophilum]|uniref:Highly reducing polyketide synthase gloL n=1 Tax=Cladobotryum mycophilum TaxID=491253 RepID=A0ABR0SHF1_9HYPO
MTSDRNPPEPIAIIGMGLRLPGGVSTPDDFWDLLVEKRDGKCRVPKDRYNVEAFHGDKTSRQNVATEYGYFLKDVNIKTFDASFFSAKRAEVEVADPQQRLLLEVVWECMESAGQTSLRGSNTGVYVGAFGEDWHNMLHLDKQISSAYRVISAGDFVLSNRISYEFDLRGPSMTIRTACSASMTGLHLACQALYNGDCPTAIVAGSSIIMDPDMTLDMSQQGVLSPSGSCKTFDAAADGFARGEAINAILIKPLKDALRDGDPIRGVIRSTAVNSDGKTSHMGSPSTASQEAMIRRAYEVACLDDFSQTPFVECHGTGTAVGDPLEAQAVASVFGGGDHVTYIGSVKPNMGHGEGASGITSIIKGVLALEHEIIPPNINFSNPNPKIPFNEHRLQVPVEPIPWPKDRQLRVSVNSFGIGGANAHVILDSPAIYNIPRTITRKPIKSKKKPEEKTNGHSEGKTEANGDSQTDTNGHVQNESNGHAEFSDSHLQNEGARVQVSTDSDQETAGMPETTANGHVDGIKVNGSSGHTNGTSHQVANGISDTAPNGHTGVHANGETNGNGVTISELEAKENTNGHADDKEEDEKIEYIKHWPRLLTISANSSTSLQIRVDNLREYLESRPGSLDDLAHTLALHRVHMPHRTFCVADGGPLEFSAFQKTSAIGTTAEATGRVAYVFTGQGAQWAGMGKSLIEGSPSFRDDIRMMDRALQQLSEPPSWTIEGLLCAEDAESKENISKAEFSQPLCTAIQIAIVNFLSNCGVKPDAVVGHSSGEIAAAYAAGAITQDEAIVCAYLRGLATKRQTRTGSMAALGLGKDAVSQYLVDGVEIACENSPKSVTISGDSDAVDQVLEAINAKDPEIFTRKLHINMAYHSHHMREIGEIYEGMMKPHLSPKGILVPFYSSVSGHLATAKSKLGRSYWRSNLESPVLFHTAVGNLLNDLPDVSILLEIGPHSALQGPLRQIVQDRGSKKAPTYVPTLVRDHDSATSLFATAGNLYACDYAIDFTFLNPTASLLTDLPTYPFDHSQDFWKENRVSQAWRNRAHAHHELLGSRCLEASERDHKVESNVVFPCAGYIAMMGEAIRQILGSESYVLRNLMVKGALVLTENEPIELMTTMRRLRLTELTNSSTWHDISISTFNGTSWIENCIAQGRAGDEDSINKPLARTIDPCVRHLSHTSFYERMQHMGLHYGPRFKGLQNLTAHPDKDVATGSMINDASEWEATYSVHPTTLDFCIQLGAVAYSRGIARRLNSLALPIDIRHIVVNPGGPELIAEAEHDAQSGTGNLVAVDKESNKIVVKLDKGRGIEFNTGNDTKNMLHAARVTFRPDIDLLSLNGLLSRTVTTHSSQIITEKVGILALLQLLDVAQSLDVPPSGHLGKYVSWLQKERDGFLRGERNEIVPEAREWVPIDGESRQALMQSLLEELEALGDSGVSKVARVSFDASQTQTAEAILTGKLNPVEFFIENDRFIDLYGYYSTLTSADEFFQLCAHSKPQMKVLEIGAGTGATTTIALKSLLSQNGTRMYSQYVFSDVSNGFLNTAKELFKDFGGIEYKTLDIEKDPAEQDFELGTFDLVIASNVLHATASLQTSLKNVRSLLRPGGRLYLQELVLPICWRTINLNFGLLPGWWVGENDGRVDAPFVTVERWRKELLDAGFSGCDALLVDSDAPYHACANIISTAVAPAVEAKPISFLYKSERHEFALKLADALEQDGIEVQWSKIGEKELQVKGQDVISTIELEDSYFSNISEEDYKTFMDYLSTFEAGMLWLTRTAQVGCTDPRYSLVVGLARTIRAELSVEFWTAELETLDDVDVTAMVGIARKFRSREPMERILDAEYSVNNGNVNVGRYDWFALERELQSDLEDDAPKQLLIGQKGLLDSLHWVQQEAVEPKDDEVEVAIHCDIMIAMGLVKGADDCLGFEASGVITRVGSKVDKVKVGDQVMTIYSGLLATRKVVPASAIFPLPNSVTLEEAVTMPIVYATVLYCVITVARLEKGQSILIHSACGGVGQAALNVCQMLGAEIYTTVGSEEKVEYLIKNHNVPRERIFHSRDASFLDGIMQATNNRGVDFVLNSLSGDLLHASWQCVAKYGKMLEIGKRDILERGQLPLSMFTHNRTFHGIDLESLFHDDPDRMGQLTKQLRQLSDKGVAKPIRPIHAFSAESLNEAFRFFKQGKHIGKIVITIPDTKDIPSTKAIQPLSLSGASTYLLVGGLGGIGKATVRFMVERGARHFCFLSRSAGKSEQDQIFFRELESQGCHIAAVAGSVAELADVKKAVEAAPTPIAGVLQMSMVLRDQPLLQTSYEDWTTVHSPKVTGTWNLHNALSETKLDFFVLLGSLSGVVGHPGQSNYAAANSFLDSFVQYRHGLGLPCSVMDLGGVEGVGYLHDRPNKLHQYKASGLFLVQEQHLMDALQISIKQSFSSTAVTSAGSRSSFINMSQLAVGLKSTRTMADAHNRALFKGDVRFAMYNNIEETDNLSNETRDEGLREFLNEAERNPEILNDPETLERASLEIGKTLFGFLMIPEENLDVEMTLSSIGVDSLVAIEIRNWWRRTLLVEITVLEIMNTGTIKGLGKLAISALAEKYSVKRDEDGDGETGKS